MSEPSAELDEGIGRRLRAGRARLGWTREALAFHSGLSWSAIAQVEAGRRRNLRPSTLWALAGSLGVSVDYLVAGKGSAPMLEHHALLYESDDEFLESALACLSEAVKRSEAAIAITTPASIKALRDGLGDAAETVAFADRAQWYSTPRSALTGYQAFIDGACSAGAPWLRIVGEPVRTNGSEDEKRAWARYEALLDLAFSHAPLSVLCAYDVRKVDEEALAHARATHPTTIEAGSRSVSSDYDHPSSFLLER